ncbi:SDR family NAD(P)-dependent oxidoreductase [Planosporangium sp. 12N6]|uniref:SDR family NAD(P)-dependent oxidoreductase n=1 Tax=Planosporangium spinosum TaxID=3402278 RepID=UPI003CEB7FD9
MKATFDATGDVIVVTGGAQGIGAAIATACARAGARAVVLDVAEQAPALADTPQVELCTVDVSDRAAVFRAIDGVLERYGRIDGLVAGAAVQPRTPVLDTPPEEWSRVMGVNLDGVVWVCQAVVPHMVARRSGSVVVFTSGMALTGFPGAAGYIASKAALIGYAKTLAAEVAEHRVRVNVLAPGVIDTAQFRAANEGADLNHWRSTTGIGAPEDVVGPLLFLLSDAASMTGSQLTRERVFERLADY